MGIHGKSGVGKTSIALAISALIDADYGNITYFASTQIDQKDHILSCGMLYKFRKNVYANINYNWWGSKFTDQQYSDYKYNRLIFILSVEL